MQKEIHQGGADLAVAWLWCWHMFFVSSQGIQKLCYLVY